MGKKHYLLIAVIILITIFNVGLVYYVLQLKPNGGPNGGPLANLNLSDIINNVLTKKVEGIAKFTSADEFKEYLAKAPSESDYYGFSRQMAIPEVGLAAPAATDSIGLGGIGEKTSLSSGPDRISETNVQVQGIDEPDIVKTDGKEIYYSSPYFYYDIQPLDLKIENGLVPSATVPSTTEKISSESIAPMPPLRSGALKAIKAWPPADLKIDSDLNKNGELLLKNNILLVFENDKITGFDVADPKNPQEKWAVNYQDRNYLQAARLYNDSVYLVTRTMINQANPCPIIPLKYNGQELSIACTEIYHPLIDVPVDVTYNILVLDPQSGEIKNKTAFVGSSGNSVIYMSNNAIYVTYNYSGDTVAYILNFFNANKDLISEVLIKKIAKLQTYDLSNSSKLNELMEIIKQYTLTLSEDDLLKFENEMTNRLQDYSKEHNRDLMQTGIVKIDVNGLKVSANGNVPGVPLNQFSLDEYNDNLRIATTSGGRGAWSSFGLNSQSVNDVYVLDNSLKLLGAVKDLGLSEQIYSVRFIEDKGYLVTFRQTDPFYVLDLSDPKNPQQKGELKIPGFSSYLHPITKDKILGIGNENGKVKVSLFDVSNPADPKEIDKYNLDDYWTEVSNTHHAFLLDDKHKVFFLPGGRGGYIFSYDNDRLALKKSVSEISAQRAIYLEDYMYIIGSNKIVIINEKDWQTVKDLEF